MTSLIAIVDEQDNIIGFADKTEVHQKGILHRAFSIIIFNDNGEMLIHKRALDKYHSPGLWTNACCSHLQQEGDMESNIHKRLVNEMGFDCKLEYLFNFHYKVDFDNGLTENEIDYVYKGIYNQEPQPNPKEVSSFRWIGVDDLKNEISKNPESFTYWFKHIINNYLNQIIR